MSSPYIDNTTQGPDGIWPVNNVGTTTSIFHDRAGDHNNILGGVGQLLDNEVHHLSQAGIFVLE